MLHLPADNRPRLGLDDDNSSSSLDFLFCPSRDESSLNDDRFLRDSSFSEQLEVSQRCQVENRRLISELAALKIRSDLWCEERVQTIQVDGRPRLSQIVEISHTNLSEVTRMVLIHVDTVVVLTSGQTTTTRMLSVFSYTTVTGRDVASVLPGVAQVRRHS